MRHERTLGPLDNGIPVDEKIGLQVALRDRLNRFDTWWQNRLSELPRVPADPPKVYVDYHFEGIGENGPVHIILTDPSRAYGIKPEKDTQETRLQIRTFQIVPADAVTIHLKADELAVYYTKNLDGSFYEGHPMGITVKNDTTHTLLTSTKPFHYPLRKGNAKLPISTMDTTLDVLKNATFTGLLPRTLGSSTTVAGKKYF
jgi:hypothetical protein